MSNKQRTQLETMMTQIEELWGHLDVLFDSLNQSEGWDQTHGSDWIFADLPYHLAYCNRDLVGRGLEMGPDLPAAEQELISSMEALGDWNDRKFAERPAGQTVEQSIEQMIASRDYLRRLATDMSDDDLERPFWMPVFAGWTTARVGLDFIRAHDCSEFIQLRAHMGLTEPMPSSEITHNFLNTILNYFPAFLNQEAAVGQQLTTVNGLYRPRRRAVDGSCGRRGSHR